MKLEGIMLSEVRQIERGKYCMISHVKSKTSNLEKTKLRETENNWGLPEVGWKWGKWVKMLKRYILAVTIAISSGDGMYNMVTAVSNMVSNFILGSCKKNRS